MSEREDAVSERDNESPASLDVAPEAACCGLDCSTCIESTDSVSTSGCVVRRGPRDRVARTPPPRQEASACSGDATPAASTGAKRTVWSQPCARTAQAGNQRAEGRLEVIRERGRAGPLLHRR
eukprot:2156598-Prymnesium_polylepis.1